MTVFDSWQACLSGIRPRHCHACGYRLANDGVDTRALQAYLGYRNIQNTTPTPRWRLAGSRVFSRLITRTRISSDREGCRVGVAQLDCARLYSDDDFEPSQRQP
jgi:hypothetical protein